MVASPSPKPAKRSPPREKSRLEPDRRRGEDEAEGGSEAEDTEGEREDDEAEEDESRDGRGVCRVREREREMLKEDEAADEGLSDDGREKPNRGEEDDEEGSEGGAEAGVDDPGAANCEWRFQARPGKYGCSSSPRPSWTCMVDVPDRVLALNRSAPPPGTVDEEGGRTAVKEETSRADALETT